MLKKNINFFILLLMLTSCGFTPVNINKNNLNFEVKIINIEGDLEINNIIRSKLTQKKSSSEDNNNNELFEIEINTNYQKNIFSKNLTGTAENYLLDVVARVSITNKNIKKDFVFKENFLMKNINDQFEQAQYERNTKKSFANSLSEKIISTIQFEK